MKVKVLEVTPESITFDNGMVLGSYHDQDCCESHYLSFTDLSLKDFHGLEFDISGEEFFKRIDGYGIELIPVEGWSVRVPGYGSNNGYYSSDLDLVLYNSNGGIVKSFDISECQEISE